MSSASSVHPDQSSLEQAKLAPEALGLEPVIARRWSPRSFSSRPVPDADLRRIFAAATWAASSYNEQPWRFLVGRKDGPTYQKIFDCLGEFNQAWAQSAPVLALSAARKSFTHNNSTNRFAMHDTGAATANLMLQAIALGIHTHAMAGFDDQKARQIFNIPAEFDVGAVIALGYLGPKENLPERFRQQETAPRSRKTLAEVVFSEWERPADF